MADRNSVEEIIAAGEAHSDSPILISTDGGFPASRHASIAVPADQDGKDGDGDLESTGSPTSAPSVREVRGRQVSIASTGFSEAPTAITAASDYTANTGGRARCSWRGDIPNFWRGSATLPARRPSAEAQPLHQDGGAEPSTSDVSSDDDLPVELPASAVERPDEPGSFFHSDSESEGESIIRTASRASSSRTQRPKLIEHHPSNGSLGQSRFYRAMLPASSGPSQKKAEQILGTKLSNLHELSPFDEKSNPIASASDEQTSTATTTAITTANPTAPGQTGEPSQRPGGSSLVIEVPNTPMRAEVLDTLPSAFAGFGALRLDKRKSSQLTVSPLDALRSNPVTFFDTAGLHRSTSAPPVPHGQKRQVKIRPMDMEAVRTASEKKLFRDAVVSTPYPFRHSSSRLAAKQGPRLNPTQTIKTLLPATKEGMATLSHAASHGSPPEILVLELSLAKQRLATKMVTIAIHDRSSFDDYALFTAVRRKYNHDLLGPGRRYFSARLLSDATLVFSSASFSGSYSSSSQVATVNSFDAASFLQQLAHPKRGRKRKTWLQWLRRRQPGALAINASTTATSAHPSGSGSHPCFSANGVPHSPAFVDPRPPPRRPPPETTPDHVPSPATASPPDQATSSHSPSCTNPTIPKIILHHSFSPVRLAVAMALLTSLTVLATALWVVLGYPGPRPVDRGDEDDDELSLFGGGGDWQVAAQNRVTTGLLLGLLVFFLGAAKIGAWILMSWVTL